MIKMLNIKLHKILTQMIRLTVTKRIFLIPCNIHWWQQRETRRDQWL
jgi:hypothetical protein